MALKQYRTDYTGEFVITNTVFKEGQKVQEREWIANPIENTSLNNRACCIAPGTSIDAFPMKRLEQHRGDLLGRNKMQLYAVEEVWERMTTDFNVVLDPARLAAMIEAGYQVDNIVYTTARQCIKNPGEFYLIPFGTSYIAPVTAIWLACFDGHKDIYLFGYDEVFADGKRQTKMIELVRNIMETFNDVNFHHVSNAESPDDWRRCINLRTISQREFVTECDI